MRNIPVLITFCAFLAGVGIGLTARSGRASASEPSGTHAADRSGVEKLRRADIDATLTQEPGAITALWSEDGVNLQTPGVPAVGTNALREFYGKFRSEHPEFRVVRYSPDFKEIQFVDGWAIEVVNANATFKMSATDEPITARQELVRVLKRQSDGSWKFALVGQK